MKSSTLLASAAAALAFFAGTALAEYPEKPVNFIVPWPGLFQNHIDFVVALYIALLILNVLVLIFLLVATKSLVQVVKIPNRFLGVFMLTLGFVEVYSLRNSATDCMLAAGFGVFGYVLKCLSLPAVPVILGMVLGGIME